MLKILLILAVSNAVTPHHVLQSGQDQSHIEKSLIVFGFIYEGTLVLVGQNKVAYLFNVKTGSPTLKIREPEDRGKNVLIVTEKRADGRVLEAYVYLPTRSLYLIWRKAILFAQMCSEDICARKVIMLLVKETTWNQVKLSF